VLVLLGELLILNGLMTERGRRQVLGDRLQDLGYRI